MIWDNFKDLEKLDLQYRAVYKSHCDRRSNLEIEINTYEKEDNILNLVEKSLLSLSSELTKKITTEIEDLVNSSLSAIFDDISIYFEIEIITYRGNTGLKFNLYNNGNKLGALQHSEAGGIIVVISFLLRLISIILSKKERFLILDESFAHVSEKYLENLGLVIKKICKDMNFNILLVTHKKSLQDHADTHYELTDNFKKIK